MYATHKTYHVLYVCECVLVVCAISAANQTKASNFICYHIYVIDFVDWLALRFHVSIYQIEL